MTAFYEFINVGFSTLKNYFHENKFPFLEWPCLQ